MAFSSRPAASRCVRKRRINGEITTAGKLEKWAGGLHDPSVHVPPGGEVDVGAACLSVIVRWALMLTASSCLCLLPWSVVDGLCATLWRGESWVLKLLLVSMGCCLSGSFMSPRVNAGVTQKKSRARAGLHRGGDPADWTALRSPLVSELRDGWCGCVPCARDATVASVC